MLRSAFLVLLAGTCATTPIPHPAIAAPGSPITFTLTSTPRPDTVQLQLIRGADLSHRTSVSAASLAPFDASPIAGSRTAVAFALVRQPGRLDSVGSGGGGVAEGRCRFFPDRGFAAFLASHGIALPDQDATLDLVLAGATRELVQAIEHARYSAPTLDQLTALAALRVSPDDLARLGAIGDRPTDIPTLITYKALDVTPAFIAELANSRHRNVSPSEIIQSRALGVSGDRDGSLGVRGAVHSGIADVPAAPLRMQERRR